VAEDAVSVLILAGGRSRRMGQDKIWMELDGRPLIEWVVRRVLPVAGEILLSANAPGRLAAFADSLRGQGVPSRIVADSFAGAGPLAGLHAGLSVARCELLLALAADMPFVSLALAARMIELAPGFDAVVPQMPVSATAEPSWEPLHALYRRSCLPAIETRLAVGERQMTCFLPHVRTRAITAEECDLLDPARLSFFNVNTIEDWRAAQRLAAEHGLLATRDGEVWE